MNELRTLSIRIYCSFVSRELAFCVDYFVV